MFSVSAKHSSDSGEESLDNCLRQVMGVAKGSACSIFLTRSITMGVGDELELSERNECKVSRSDVLFAKEEWLGLGSPFPAALDSLVARSVDGLDEKTDGGWGWG